MSGPMVRCVKCGHLLGPEAFYCDQCGAKTTLRRPSQGRIVAVMVLVVAGVIGAIAWAAQLSGQTPTHTASSSGSTAKVGLAAKVTPTATPTPVGPTPTMAVSGLSALARPCADPATPGSPAVAYAGTPKTSCGLALAVRAAYAALPDHPSRLTLRAVSPAAGKSYAFTCSGTAPVTCVGDKRATVLIVG